MGIFVLERSSKLSGLSGQCPEVAGVLSCRGLPRLGNPHKHVQQTLFLFRNFGMLPKCMGQRLRTKHCLSNNAERLHLSINTLALAMAIRISKPGPTNHQPLDPEIKRIANSYALSPLNPQIPESQTRLAPRPRLDPQSASPSPSLCA